MMGFYEKDLAKLFPLIEDADVVIGFNIDDFDIPTFTPYYQGDLSKIPTLDLMDKIKKSSGRCIFRRPQGSGRGDRSVSVPGG